MKFFSLLLLLAGCSKIVYPPNRVTERNVLLEVFGYNRCTNCPFSDHAADSLYTEFGGKVFVLEYHYLVSALPSQFQDTLSPQPVTNNRCDWYNVTAFPTAFIDGNINHEGADENVIDTYRNYINVDLSKQTPLGISLENDEFTNSGIIKVHLTYSDSIPFEKTRLFLIITEDSVLFVQSGVEDSVYNHTVRTILPDSNGLSITENDTIEELPYSIKNFWNKKRLEAVVFIQNVETKEIYQTKGIKF